MRAVVRGAGSIGSRHAEVLRSIGAEVDLWPVRPRPASSSGTHDYTGADLVIIATDTGRHVADAIEALDQGAARVLVEKPVAATAAEAEALRTHPRAACVGVAAPLRAHLAFSAVARAVAALPGRAYAAASCQSWLPDWRPDADYRRSYSARPDDGGVLRDLVHEIDYAYVLFGPPRLAGAVLETGGPLRIDSDEAASLLWTTDRATVAVRLDYVTRPSARKLVVRSASGGVVWDVLAASVTVLAPDGTRSTTEYPADRDRNAVMARQVEAFVEHDSIADVDASIRVAAGAPATLGEGIEVVRICDAARRADAQRRAMEETPDD